MRTLFLILMVWMMVGCEEDSVAVTGEIRYGTSFGECIGYCIRETLIVDRQITVVARAWDDRPAKERSAKLSEVDAAAIRSGIDVGAFEKLPSTIGCPDCADGGAEWLELQINGEAARVTFEYGSDIEGIAAGVAKLRALTQDMDPTAD